jgi:hypothetical protein
MPAAGRVGTDPSELEASAIARVASDEKSTGTSPMRVALYGEYS